VKKFLWIPILLLLASCQSVISDAAIVAAVQNMVDQGLITAEQAPAMVEALKSLLANAGGTDWGELLGSVGAAILGTLGLTRWWRGPSTKGQPKP
jgi:hypothetical protein